jgi:hypothetical protein
VVEVGVGVGVGVEQTARGFSAPIPAVVPRAVLQLAARTSGKAF